MTDREVIEREAMVAEQDREACLAQGFADCEARAVVMLTEMSEAEAREAGPESSSQNAAVRLARGARALALREAARAVTVGKLRTEDCDPDKLAAAHRRVGISPGMSSRGGKASAAALSPAQRRERAKNAGNARWAKTKEPK